MTRHLPSSSPAITSVIVLLSTCLSGCHSGSVQAPGQARFDTPDQAVDALVAALQQEDLPRAMEVLGPDSEDLVDSGDPVADRQMRELFLERIARHSRLDEPADGPCWWHIGEEDWPFPIPLVRDGDAWYFDTPEGIEEILARRIGANELDAIQVCHALVDAQREYASVDWDDDGLLEYARRFRSTPGQRDGLYWEAADGEPPSPLGPYAAEAARGGYAIDPEAPPRPFHGYYYRILEGQEAYPDGLAYDYVVRDSMIGGFAVVAYPAEYGNSGVMSFLVNHRGVVYEKDLGPETETEALAMERFAPADGWQVVDS